MKIGVEGDRNRVAGRDYQEVHKDQNLNMTISGNAGSNINFGTQINMAEKPEARDLVPAQSQELYDLGLKCVELGGDSKEIWRRVFAELGVKQIADITTDQFLEARKVLQANLDQLQEDADKRRLIGKILRTMDEKAAKTELNNFCELTFGRTHLNNLKRTELQRTLEFIQGFEIRPQATPEPQPSVEPSVSASSEAPTPSPKSVPIQVRELVVSYPWQFGLVFALGALMGKMV